MHSRVKSGDGCTSKPCAGPPRIRYVLRNAYSELEPDFESGKIPKDQGHEE
jgi:hypothetical protein